MSEFNFYPDTEHPAYANQAQMVRSTLLDGRRALQLTYPKRNASAAFAGLDENKALTDDAFGKRLLVVQRAGGPAPYVGRPFVYMWEVAVDDLGRWIAGPARIDYMPDLL